MKRMPLSLSRSSMGMLGYRAYMILVGTLSTIYYGIQAIFGAQVSFLIKDLKAVWENDSELAAVFEGRYRCSHTWVSYNTRYA